MSKKTRPGKATRPIKVHPLAVAWMEFITKFPTLASGPVDGVYLKNRLQAAFHEGWAARERMPVNLKADQ